MAIIKSQINPKAEILSSIIKSNFDTKKPLIIAVCGRSCSGKTTLTNILAQYLGANVFHIDDFCSAKDNDKKLVPHLDNLRFKKEILQPLSKKKTIFYKPYNCYLDRIEKAQKINYKNINFIEGSYSLHPKFLPFIDFCIFINISKKEQLNRLKKRENNPNIKAYKKCWLPREESFFNYLQKENLLLKKPCLYFE